MSGDDSIITFEAATDAVAFLNDQYWHDSVLYQIDLVRRDSADRVVLDLDLLGDWETGISSRHELRFEKCWHVVGSGRRSGDAAAC